MKPKPPFAVAQLWMNGARTVNTFLTRDDAFKFALNMAEMYRGNCVYFGELVEPAIEQDTEV